MPAVARVHLRLRVQENTISRIVSSIVEATAYLRANINYESS